MHRHSNQIMSSNTVQASHILVREEDMCRTIETQLRQDVEQFAELAQAHSLCPSGKQSGGDLGVFGRNQMVRAFEDVAFNLEVGAVSGCFKTDFGYHVVRRTG